MPLFKKTVVLSLLIYAFGSGLRAQIPTLEWVKKIGGTSYCGGTSIALDKQRNVYTVGYFAGTADFDPGSGVYNLAYGGNQDAFISKLDASGNFIWAKKVGGATGVGPSSVVTDTSGNVYISGQFGGTIDADPGPGVFNLTSNGGADLFILKLDASGNFIWAKQIGGTLNDISCYITADPSGNIYVAGIFSGTVDFDFSTSVFNLTDTGSGDIFVLKLTAAGNFVWVKQLGGSDSDVSTAISVDRFGNVYTAGFFYGSGDFDPGPAYYSLYSAGNSDGFVSKLDANGNFKWAKKIGGGLPDYCYSLKLDTAANAYISGSFGGVADFDPGPGVYNLTAAYQDDIFILKLDSAGNFTWAGGMGGSSVDFGYALQLDKSNTNVYVTGSFRDTVDFDPGPGVHNLVAVTPFGPSDDVFVLKLNASGNFVWVRQIGSPTGAEIARSITLDELGNIYTTGNFAGTSDFDPGPGIVSFSSLGGNTSAFIHKMTLSPVVGLEEIDAGNGSYFYPNPASTSVTIHSSTALEKTELFSITGQLILTEKATGNQHQLNLTDVANGVYVVNVYSADQKITRKKLVVQH